MKYLFKTPEANLFFQLSLLTEEIVENLDKKAFKGEVGSEEYADIKISLLEMSQELKDSLEDIMVKTKGKKSLHN